MLGRGLCDTRCVSFYTDMIRKEENKRMKWFLKNQQKLLANLKKPQDDKLPHIRESEKEPSAGIIHLKPLPNWRSLEPDTSISLDIMKPVDPHVKSTLYEDIPTFIAADNYLDKRFKEPPENRYYYPDCSNWVYGWRLKDCPPVPRSNVGRQHITRSQFYHPRLSNLNRDPEWYRSSTITKFVCNEIL